LDTRLIAGGRGSIPGKPEWSAVHWGTKQTLEESKIKTRPVTGGGDGISGVVKAKFLRYRGVLREWP